MMKLSSMLAWFLAAIMACQEHARKPETISIAGMRNSVEVDDVLIGGQPSESALEELADRGYQTVLSTRGAAEVSWDEEARVEALGMTFVSIPMENPVEEITDDQVSRFSDLMENGKRPIVLHCGSGNRVSGLWAVWLVERQHMDPEEALDLAQKAGMKGVRKVVEKRLGLQ